MTSLPGGHSGFNLRLVDNSVVEKRSGVGNAERLARQCEKQRSFTVRTPQFAVADVVWWGVDAGDFCITMPFYRADTATQFIDKARPTEVHRFIVALGELLEEFIADSPVQSVSAGVVHKKSEEVVQRLRGGPWWPLVGANCERHLAACSVLPTVLELPIGKAHGDLTLSNILFDRERGCYILLDFLDTYLESPLLDIVKIAQETQLRWSSLTSDATHDRVKYGVVMGLIQTHIMERFGSRADLRDFGALLEAQNLLRLLPYAYSERVVQTVATRLHSLGT